jgi:hypothetical protein
MNSKLKARSGCLFVLIMLSCSTSSPKRTMEKDIPKDVLNKICQNTFAQDKYASIETWEAADGSARCYALHPDLSAVSHGPVTYFDLHGNQVLVVPEFPLQPGKEYPILDKVGKLLAGLKPGKRYSNPCGLP